MAIKPFVAKKKKEDEEISLGYNPQGKAMHPHGSASASDGLNQLMYDIVKRRKLIAEQEAEKKQGDKKDTTKAVSEAEEKQVEKRDAATKEVSEKEIAAKNDPSQALATIEEEVNFDKLSEQINTATTTSLGSPAESSSIEQTEDEEKDKEGIFLITDINRPLEEEKERKLLHIAFVLNKMAASSEGIEELNNQTALVLKRRSGPLYSPQLDKWNELTLKDVETGLELIDLEYLSDEEKERCLLVQFSKDPMEMSRAELEVLAGPSGGYGFHNGKVYFVTAGGQLSIARSPDFYNTQFELCGIHPKDLISNPELKNKYAGKITYFSYEDKIYLAEGTPDLTLQGPYDSPSKGKEKVKKAFEELFAPEKDKDGNPIPGPKDILEWQMDEFESLIHPFNSQNTKSLCELFINREKNPTLAGLSTLDKITQITGHKAHKEALPLSYVETLEYLGILKNHILKEVNSWKKEDQTIENISAYVQQFPQVYNFHTLEHLFFNDHKEVIRRDVKAGISHFNFNSQLHKNLNPNHFKVPFKEPAIIRHIEIMYEGLAAVIMKEAIELFRKRGTVNGKSFGDYPELEQILGEEELVYPKYTKEDLAKWNVDKKLWSNLLKPVSLPKRYGELLSIYQTEIKKSTDAGELVDSDFEDFLDIALFSKIFKRINALLTKAFTNIKQAISDIVGNQENVVDIRRKLGSLFHLPFQKVVSHGIPKAKDIVCAIIDSGFPPPKKPNGEYYTAEEMSDYQTKHMVALMYRHHLKHPLDKFECGLNEMEDQPVKLKFLKDFIELVNKHVNKLKNAPDEEKEEILSKHKLELDKTGKYVAEVLLLMEKEDARRLTLKNATANIKILAPTYELKHESKVAQYETKNETRDSTAGMTRSAALDLLSGIVPQKLGKNVPEGKELDSVGSTAQMLTKLEESPPPVNKGLTIDLEDITASEVIIHTAAPTPKNPRASSPGKTAFSTFGSSSPKADNPPATREQAKISGDPTVKSENTFTP